MNNNPPAPKPVKKVCAKDMAEKAVLLRYEEAGWSITLVKGAINDFIAHKQKDNKLHFVQIYVPGDARHEQLAKNTFIQNAFSNNAVPVFAVVTPQKKVDNTIEFRVTFADANTDSRIIINRTKSAAKSDVPETSTKPTPEPKKRALKPKKDTELK